MSKYLRFYTSNGIFIASISKSIEEQFEIIIYKMEINETPYKKMICNSQMDAENKLMEFIDVFKMHKHEEINSDEYKSQTDIIFNRKF